MSTTPPLPSSPAALFFEELEHAIALRPDNRAVYEAFNAAFCRLLHLLTAETPLLLGGTFAKVDYLLKEHAAPSSLSAAVNATRIRLRRSSDIEMAMLEHYCLYDLKHLCHFAAFVCHCEVPAALAALCPADEPRRHAATVLGDYLRVIVERWDDDSIYVRREDSDDSGLTPVDYTRGDERQELNYGYLRELLHEGTQLNLIRPRLKDNRLYAEQIIYEPDYLVSISSVAHCFTDYTDSSTVHLLKMLEPSETTSAILLGNFAGQLLDEAIHDHGHPRPYADSVKTFFRDNAVSMMTTNIDNDFHQQAQLQQKHIAQALHEALPAALKRFDIDEGIVEPSFFSEMLGLQGRMDYLQMDYRVLLEQKSGKGAFPQNDYSTPLQKDEHYVQLLLYMEVIRCNYREIYERNGRELHAFLLYSKYSKPLLGLSAAPELTHHAFRIRNCIAAMAMQQTEPDGFHLLETLTPDSLREKQMKDNFWNNWILPQISSVLNPIQNATPLERAYCLRFLRFIATEHVMAKTGNKYKPHSGFAATWHDTLEEKRAAGNIYDRLILLTPEADDTGRISRLTLTFDDGDNNDMANFRRGDIVILYPYDSDKEPDVRQTMTLRCNIDDICADTLHLTLRAPQADSRFFVRGKDRRWAIEHDFTDSSFGPLYRGIHALLTAPQERRDLLLLQKQPQTDPTRQLKGSYGNFDELALRVKRAQDLFLIIGPPGTGKTSFALLHTVEEELQEPDANVLLAAFTNRAVDEICSKLDEAGIDFLRIGSATGCGEAWRDRLLSNKAETCANRKDLIDMMCNIRVVVGTTASLNNHIALLQLKAFSLAVIDEASQLLEPHLMPLLTARQDNTAAIKKVVLIGDHKQLTAVVQQNTAQSKVDDTQLHDILLTDCRQSLFERMLRRYADNEDITYMLTRQGRMHADIARFPNERFYHRRLTEALLPHQCVTLPRRCKSKDIFDKMLSTRRVAFINVETPQRRGISDKVNINEATVIADIVARIYRREQASFDADSTVGVIVPYRNQIAAVRHILDSYGIAALHDITIDTVERFQGSQRRYIVYGFTVQRRYQLQFLTDNVFRDYDDTLVDRKLNVVMTRAQEHLIMTGNAALLCHDAVFADLIDFMKEQACFYEGSGITAPNGKIPESKHKN